MELRTHRDAAKAITATPTCIILDFLNEFTVFSIAVVMVFIEVLNVVIVAFAPDRILDTSLTNPVAASAKVLSLNTKATSPTPNAKARMAFGSSDFNFSDTVLTNSPMLSLNVFSASVASSKNGPNLLFFIKSTTLSLSVLILSVRSLMTFGVCLILLIVLAIPVKNPTTSALASEATFDKNVNAVEIKPTLCGA